MTRLGIVIPVLNEQAALPGLLADLAQQRGCALEVVVADGGSTDDTLDIARRHGATCIRAPRGRAAQMNAGAACAQSPLLLFLHADTRLPDAGLLARAVSELEAETGRGGSHRLAGHFRLCFERKPPGFERVFDYLEAKTALNRPGTINGDQGFLLRQDYFVELGGFDTGLPFLEDQRLAAKVDATGRWLLLPGTLTTSARRFESEGVAQRLSLMALLMGLHAAGEHELLAQMPDIYAQQDRAVLLSLAPFHRRIRRALWRKGPMKILWRGGRYVRQNAWQLAFRRDVRRWGRDAGENHPALDRFDRLLARWLDNRLIDGVAALLLAGWLYGWLPLTESR